jgi:hypothetical protein
VFGSCGIYLRNRIEKDDSVPVLESERVLLESRSFEETAWTIVSRKEEPIGNECDVIDDSVRDRKRMAAKVSLHAVPCCISMKYDEELKLKTTLPVELNNGVCGEKREGIEWNRFKEHWKEMLVVFFAIAFQGVTYYTCVVWMGFFTR